MALGQFPPHDDDEISVSVGAAVITAVGDILRRVVKTDGTVTAVDFPMIWKPKTNPTLEPSTTHEIAFDMINGFDDEFVYLSGMNVNSIARVSKVDPTRQQIFVFPVKDGLTADPHTLIFSNVKSEENVGMLWVGLENQGRIVKLNMMKIMENRRMDAREGEADHIHLKDEDFSAIYDVRISGNGMPKPINTRPHGFCFDKDHKYIWFTGKLTNTVGRVSIHNNDLQHFELPTLGAVPIYIALGPDNNIWGTCLGNNIIYRVTTGEHPVVHEMPISLLGAKHRPIAIKPDPRGFNDDRYKFMWFSNEATHSICRIDINAFEKYYVNENKGCELDPISNSKMCVCSSACQFQFRKKNEESLEMFHADIIAEIPIPKVNRKMKLGALALDKDGAIWTQSYVDLTITSAEDNVEALSDYIIKLGGFNLDESNTAQQHDKAQRKAVSLNGVQIDFYEVPTKNTQLHRICIDQHQHVWFTELGSDRVGAIFRNDNAETVCGNMRKRLGTSNVEQNITSKKREKREGENNDMEISERDSDR